MTAMVVLQFDMRASPDCPEPAAVRYRACLDMVRWADRQAIDVVGFSEHHNTEDGFLSSPLLLATAAAACTSRVRLSVSALLLPLHEPLRIAEDIAVLDLLSGGRFSATVGLGYRESEYRSLGVDWARRGQILDEKIALLLQAWGGEPFSYRGERVQLNPLPQRPARQLLCVGGNSVPAARRAARFGLMFAPAIDDPALAEAYETACREAGFEGGLVIYPREPSLTLIAEDPERSWAEIGHFLLYDARAYQQWRHPTRRAYAESAATSLDELQHEGKYRILTPAQALESMRQKGSLNLAPLCGGVPLEHGWRSLELYAERVAPAFAEAGA